MSTGFLQGIGKALDKASQGFGDAAQSIQKSVQEQQKSASRERLDKKIEKEKQKREEQEKIAEALRKCPKCGQPLKAMTAVCSLCGYEMRNSKTTNSVLELTREINKLEKNRNTVTDKLSTIVSGRKTHPTDEKIASLIRNYIVPNNKEDIMEFMILAAGNMDAGVLAGAQRESQVSEVIIKAWESKFHQTYQKAHFSFGEDEDFSKIDNLYHQKLFEIEQAKPIFSKSKKLFGR